MRYKHLIAVDPSLTCSGWALFRVVDQKLIAVGKLRSLPPTSSLPTRLADLQHRVKQTLQQFTLGSKDLLVCEGETTMKDPRAAIRVERVRSIFESVGRDLKLTVPGRINPRTVQSELMGFKGRQPKREIVKAQAIHVCSALYKEAFKNLQFEMGLSHLKKNQDIVDAVLVGTVALTRVKAAEHGISLEELFNPTRRRRRGRNSWGAGGENSLGWSNLDLRKFLERET